MPTISPLSIEELEAGLRALDSGRVDPNAFWDANMPAFRQTVLIALHETAEALSSDSMPPCQRSELETQVESLRECLDLAERHMAARCRQLPETATLH